MRGINLLADIENFEKQVLIKVRSTGKLLDAKVAIKNNFAEVDILQDEKGISPGQACVIYSKDSIGERVLGGGWIEKTENKNYPHN